MRYTPLVGTKPWFGPRGRGGWGWSPITWQGWLSIVLVFAAIISIPTTTESVGLRLAGSLIVTAAAVLLAVLKGTSPGGPKRKAEFERWRTSTRRP
jgi:hypothetical protein